MNILEYENDSMILYSSCDKEHEGTYVLLIKS